MVKLYSLSEVGDKPYQALDYQFPRREFGIKNVVRRSFQAAVWFRKWPFGIPVSCCVIL